MKRKIDEAEFLRKMFRRNPDNGNYIIEIFLEKYIYAFNEWDSSYFRRRDIDPDLSSFLADCSDEIPLKFGLDLLFTVSQPQDRDKESQLETSVKNYFMIGLFEKRRALRTLYVTFLRYLGLAAVFFVAYYLSSHWVHENVWLQVLTEGLIVGGWVFCWEAFSLISFNRADLRRKIKEYQRLVNANMVFTY